MMVRRSGLFVAGMLLVAACSSGSDTEPQPLETTPPETTPVPSTDGTSEPTVPSTEAAVEVEETSPDPTTTEAAEPPAADGPVEVFREAAEAFNEVQLNPTDESIRPAAYDLMTERFRADRSFEVATGDPEFLNPWKDLVVLSRAEVDESGEVATLWYCQRLANSADEEGREVSSVYLATMERVGDQWLWGDRDLLASSPESNGCPPEIDAERFVSRDVADEIEEAVSTLQQLEEAALAAPNDATIVDAYLSAVGADLGASDGEFLSIIADAGEGIVSDPGAFNDHVVLSTPVASGEDAAYVVVCTPENDATVVLGSDNSDLNYDRRTFVLGFDFERNGDDWILVDRTRIARSVTADACIPA